MVLRMVILAALLLSGCAHASGAEPPGRYVTDAQAAVYTVGVMLTGVMFGFVAANSMKRKE